MTNSTQTYQQFATLYDVYVAGFNSDFLFYNNYCNSSAKILEVGCGTGRVLRNMLERGCSVTGVDISNNMLERASKKLSRFIDNGNLTLLNHNFCNSTLNQKFEVIIISFYTFNYILDNPQQFLINIAQSLSTGGIILLDLFYPKSLSNPVIYKNKLHKAFQTEGIKMDVYDTRTVNDNIETRSLDFIVNGNSAIVESKRKYYSPQNIKDLLKNAGFNDIKMACGYDYENLSEIILECDLEDNYIVKASK